MTGVDSQAGGHRIPWRMLTTSPQILVACIAVTLASCSVLPEALQPLEHPAIDARTRHWAGSPLTGPVEHIPAIEADAPIVSCRLLYIDELPETLLDPVLKRTHLIASATGSSPIQATADIHSSARVGTGQDAIDFLDDINGFFGLGQITGLGGMFGRRVITLKEMRGLVIPEATTSFAIISREPFDVPSLGLINRRISVMASRSDAKSPHTIQISLVTQDILARREDNPLAGHPPALRTEVIVLDISPEIGGTPIVLAAPSPFPGGAPHAFVLVLSFQSEEETGSAYPDIVKQCREDLEQVPATTESNAPGLADNKNRLRELEVTFKALEFARDHRPTLIHLATSTDASLAEDLALSANEEELAAYVVRLLNAGGSIMGTSQEQLAWRLEENAFAMLADLLDTEKITTILAGMFARHAGEAARFPGTMRSILENCPNQATLQQRIIAENRAFLEDARPSSRVRAFDWLALRKAAPPNFDPLASREARRKALAALATEAGR